MKKGTSGMLYWLTGLSDGGDFFNLFRYITFRAGGAFFTALIFGFLFGQPLIDFLRRKQKKGQPIRDDGPQSHLAKAGTPTMGGLLILSALIVSTILWARPDNPYVWIVLMVTAAFGFLGFTDDYAKVTKQNTKGVSSRIRLIAGFIIAALAGYAAARLHPADLSGQLALPVFKDTLINLSFLFVPFAMFVIVGAANAVNFTDGLDGLAVMPVMIAAGAFGIIAYLVGNVNFVDYLGVHFIPGHPIAGTEKSGPDAGFAELFENRWCIFTPLPDTDPEALETPSEFRRLCAGCLSGPGFLQRGR